MYNAHRGMVPAPNSRLTELLDQLRQEFESQSRSTGEFEHQCMCSICRLPSAICKLSPILLPPLRPSLCLASQMRIAGASPISLKVASLSMATTSRSRNALNGFLTDRSCSYRPTPGDGDDPSEGVSTGANPG
jgi:hypothetical protein